MLCITFNWHGEAPNDEAGEKFADEATDALIEVAEKYGCLVGGGFRVVAECDTCRDLRETE